MGTDPGAGPTGDLAEQPLQRAVERIDAVTARATPAAGQDDAL
jgi:hypothetical protein